MEEAQKRWTLETSYGKVHCTSKDALMEAMVAAQAVAVRQQEPLPWDPEMVRRLQIRSNRRGKEALAGIVDIGTPLSLHTLGEHLQRSPTGLGPVLGKLKRDAQRLYPQAATIFARVDPAEGRRQYHFDESFLAALQGLK